VIKEQKTVYIISVRHVFVSTIRHILIAPKSKSGYMLIGGAQRHMNYSASEESSLIYESETVLTNTRIAKNIAKSIDTQKAQKNENEDGSIGSVQRHENYTVFINIPIVLAKGLSLVLIPLHKSESY